MGTATNLSGDYAILNISPGIIDVKVMMIGYESMSITNVAVSVDQTTRLDIQLNVQALEGSEVTVVAQTKIIQFDVTNSEAKVTANQIDVMPVTDIHDVLKLQGGVTQDAGGGIHIRGGRSSEIVYMVDGVSLTDVYDGSLSVPIENNNIQELQVISGTFNAEYGRAMSGIINMVTKDGGNDYDFGIKIYSGDKITGDLVYTHLNTYNLTTDKDLELSASGPLVKNLLTFYSSGRYYSSDGWLGGINTFTMYGDTVFTDNNGNLIRDLEEPFTDLNSNDVWDVGEIYSDLGNGAYDDGEPFIDCGVDGLCVGDSGYPGPDFGETNGIRDVFESYSDLGNEMWDPGESLKTPEFNAMNWREKWSMQKSHQLVKDMEKDIEQSVFNITVLTRLETIENSEIEQYGTNNSIKSNVIHCIHGDDYGNIWIGTNGGGLFKYEKETKKIEGFTTKNGLKSNIIESISSDKEGNIWFASSVITKYDTKQKTFTHFTQYDGITGSFPARSAFRSIEGKLVFANSNGVLVFNPEIIPEKSNVSPPLFTNLKIKGIPVHAND